MSDWTPTAEQVRSHYVFDQTDTWQSERGEAFDRWLAAERAHAWDEGFDAGVNHDLGDYEVAPAPIVNPYRAET